MPGNKQVFNAAMNAADRYRWDSHWADAAQEYQRALAEFPEDATARGGLGFCYMQTKQWQQALDEYEYTLKRDPSNVIALSKTAELYGILHRRADAYKAYLHLADLYSQAGQGARAEAAWQKAVQLSPGDPEPHERLAAYYLGKKDFALMIQERLDAAQGYLQRNDFIAARTQCEEILRTDATNMQAQRMLSMIRAQMQQASGPLSQGANTINSSIAGATANMPSGPLAFTGSPMAEMAASGNTSGGNTGIMGNMGNFGGGGNPGPSLATTGIAGGGMDPTSRRRVTASQVTGVLRQAQTFQTQGRFNDAIDLCEQILESGFDRPDARYFLGWLYQEQQRWDEAIRQFQMLLNDPDYALSCYYALGQCYRARGDLRTATVHFDEAVDRVNLDALTMEESDQLVQLCQEAAEAHRMLGEQEQAVTVYSALLGFLHSRGWNEQVAQVEFMLQQMQNAPAPGRPVTPPPQQQPPATPPQQQQQPFQDAPTMAFNANNMQANAAFPASAQVPASPQASMPGVANSSAGELPDWLTGILNDSDKAQAANKQPPVPAPSAQPQQSL
ncbi:MAG: tetratricopeptide repeat protein, partial [Ktedonobacteraceae bacterium]